MHLVFDVFLNRKFLWVFGSSPMWCQGPKVLGSSPLCQLSDKDKSKSRRNHNIYVNILLLLYKKLKLMDPLFQFQVWKASEITTPWLAHTWADSAATPPTQNLRKAEGLHSSSFFWWSGISLTSSPNSHLCSNSLSPHKSHQVTQNKCVMIFLHLKLLFFYTEFQLFIQNQNFIFRLKKYEGKKLQSVGRQSSPTKYMQFSDYHFLLFLKFPSVQ